MVCIVGFLLGLPVGFLDRLHPPLGDMEIAACDGLGALISARNKRVYRRGYISIPGHFGQSISVYNLYHNIKRFSTIFD
jgi:hypothetical protein